MDATERIAAESLDNQVGFLLRRAYQRASANLVDAISAFELTAPQFAVLSRLHERGAVSQNLLGRLVAMEPANIRDVVHRLRTRALVSTKSHPTDGRLIVVGLTPAGLALVKQLLSIEAECTARTLAPLHPREQRQLYDFLRRIADAS
jgi:DNA-binding MarR family transcriptional regulator